MALGAGLFVWGRHYLTRVEDIDHQHEEIAFLLNELHAERKQGAKAARQCELFDGLVRAVAQHFKTEESYMKDFRYDGFELHRAEHKSLTQKALYLRKELESGAGAAVDEGLEDIKEWFRNHLMTSDRRMGRFLAERLGL